MAHVPGSGTALVGGTTSRGSDDGKVCVPIESLPGGVKPGVEPMIEASVGGEPIEGGISADAISTGATGG